MATLYYGGDIVTMETPGATAEALLTADDGTIAFVGSLEEAQARAADLSHTYESVNLDGACLMPGFLDAHSHFTGMAQRYLNADLAEAHNFNDILRLLRVFADTHPDAGAITGINYDQNQLDEGRHPNRHLLDQVSTTLPIVTSHISGHVCACNTAMLRALGFNAATPDPDGGRYGRDEYGELTGYAEEPSAIMPVLTRASELNGGISWVDYADDIQNDYLSHGITTCQDGATVAGYDDQLVALAERGGLKMDLVSYPMIGMPIDAMFAAHPEYTGPEYRHHLRFGGAKMFLDGSPQARGAWLSEPYDPASAPLGEPEGFAGHPTMDDDAVYDFALHAIDTNRQLLAHCNGDAACEQFLTQYTRALDASTNPSKRNLRPVMVHAQLARRDQFARMAAIGMIPSLFVSHCWYWGDVHLRNLGSERGGRVSAARDAVDCGLPLTFHTDSPIVPPSLIFSAWCAMTRITRGGVMLDASQRINAWHAFSAITRNTAYQYGEERSKGTLTAGKRANLVVLSANPFAASASATPDVTSTVGIHNTNVVQTIINGATVWRS